MICWGCLMNSSVPIHLCHDERVATEVGKWVGWDFRVVVCNCGGDWGPSALSLHFVGCDHPPQPLRYLGLLGAVFQDMPQSPDVGFDVGLGVLVT